MGPGESAQISIINKNHQGWPVSSTVRSSKKPATAPIQRMPITYNRVVIPTHLRRPYSQHRKELPRPHVVRLRCTANGKASERKQDIGIRIESVIIFARF